MVNKAPLAESPQKTGNPFLPPSILNLLILHDSLLPYTYPSPFIPELLARSDTSDGTHVLI